LQLLGHERLQRVVFENRRVVDERRRRRAEALRAFGDEAGRFSEFPEIGPDRDAAPSAREHRIAKRESLGRGSVVMDADVPAFGGELLDDGRADAPGASSHQRDTTAHHFRAPGMSDRPTGG
jgi:hypothetical protein